MLTEIQTVILTCLLGPEDPTAWAREQSRQWRLDNPDRVREVAKRYYLQQLEANHRSYDKHRDQRCLEVKKYRQENPEKTRALSKRMKDRKKTRASWKLETALRTRLRDALRCSGVPKTSKTMDLLGCPKVWLEVHLESLFKPGMTWENHGSVWHIDHIKPCAAFNLADPEQQKICFHWTNLQPLFAIENLKKGDKYVG